MIDANRASEIEVARSVHRKHFTRPKTGPTIAYISSVVAAAFSMEPKDLLIQSNVHSISEPRRIAAYLARDMSGRSFPEIGRFFKQHHTTILHSCRSIEYARLVDPELNGFLGEMRTAITEQSVKVPIAPESRANHVATLASQVKDLTERVAALERILALAVRGSES